MEIFTVVVQAATALAIVFAAWQLLSHSRQMHRDFEMLYVQRYWQLMDRRSARLVNRGIAKSRDREVIRAYLQLCEDEVDLRRTGRVTDSTWVFWSVATLRQCRERAYAEELRTAPPGLYRGLRAVLAGEGRRDPLVRNWLWRRLHGL